MGKNDPCLDNLPLGEVFVLGLGSSGEGGSFMDESNIHFNMVVAL